MLLEKGQLIAAFRQGAIGEDVYEALAADVDARLLELQSGDGAAADGRRQEQPVAAAPPSSAS